MKVYKIEFVSDYNSLENLIVLMNQEVEGRETESELSDRLNKMLSSGEEFHVLKCDGDPIAYSLGNEFQNDNVYDLEKVFVLEKYKDDERIRDLISTHVSYAIHEGFDGIRINSDLDLLNYKEIIGSIEGIKLDPIITSQGDDVEFYRII